MPDLEIKLRWLFNQVQTTSERYDEEDSKETFLARSQAVQNCFRALQVVTQAGHTVVFEMSNGQVSTVRQVGSLEGLDVITFGSDRFTGVCSYQMAFGQVVNLKILPGAAPATLALMADWWAARLQEGRKFDNGTGIDASVMQSLSGETATLTVPVVTEAQAETFRVALLALLPSRVDRWGRLDVSVDYDPDDTLLEAGRLAGITKIGQYLPIKSTTSLSIERLVAVNGYDGNPETLYELNF